MSYFLKLTFYSLFVTLLVFCWNQFIPPEYTSLNAYFIIAYFAIFSFVTHLWLVKSLSSPNKSQFTMRFMVASGIKLFLSVIIIIVYAMMKKQDTIPFAILFLFNYFLFTGFEIPILLKQIKSK